jgi:hypothetical protein
LACLMFHALQVTALTNLRSETVAHTLLRAGPYSAGDVVKTLTLLGRSLLSFTASFWLRGST